MQTYGYRLPCCGYRFRSHTPSMPDDSGNHHFFCRRCKADVTTAEPAEARPVKPDGRRYGDGELARAMDKAILKDRIAARLTRSWTVTVSFKDVMRELGVSERLVWQVAGELGIFQR